MIILADGNSLKSIQKAHDGSLERSKIGKHIRFHDLRRTFASHLVMVGMDLRTVTTLMGHKDIKMTMRCAHLAPDDLQAVVGVLSSELGAKDRPLAIQFAEDAGPDHLCRDHR